MELIIREIPKAMHIADPRQVPAGVFLYTLRPLRLAMLTEGPTPEEQALAGQHWEYSIDLLKRGILSFAGRTTLPDADCFAIAVIRAGSEREADSIMNADPAVAGGVFTAKLYPFQPMLMGEWPAKEIAVSYD